MPADKRNLFTRCHLGAVGWARGKDSARPPGSSQSQWPPMAWRYERLGMALKRTLPPHPHPRPRLAEDQPPRENDLWVPRAGPTELVLERQSLGAASCETPSCPFLFLWERVSCRGGGLRAGRRARRPLPPQAHTGTRGL